MTMTTSRSAVPGYDHTTSASRQEEIIPPAALPPRGRRPALPVLACLAATLAATLALGKSEPLTQTAPWGTGEDAEEEKFLLEGEVVEVKELGDGITKPLRVTLRLGDRTGRAIFKDIDQEYARAVTDSVRLADTYFSDRWQNEVAAYRLDRLIGLRLVPPTVIRTINGKTGSLQHWVENAIKERDRVEQGIALTDPSRLHEASALMKAFDALIYNVDRNQRNVLIVEPGTTVALVDHSRSFRLQKNLPLGRKEKLPIPAGFAEQIMAPSEEAIRSALAGLLTKGQIDGVLARRKAIVKMAEEEKAEAGSASK